MLATHTTLMPSVGPVVLGEHNLREVVRGLPRVTERALRFALNLRYGSLTIGLPNGRWVRIEGAGPGPHGTVVIHDLSAVSRFVRGGDIAFAEAYFDGQWDSPDLTAFLQVFSVNLDMINDLAARLPLPISRAGSVTGCAATPSATRAETSSRITTSATPSSRAGSTRR